MKPTSSATSQKPPLPEDDPAPGRKIGLALSGGGSRAIAFHLGCLRALNEVGLLSRVRILSTVSGGSVIGALYSAFDEPFSAFEQRVRQLLEQGLARPTLRAALTTMEGPKALSCFLMLGLRAMLGAPLAWLARMTSTGRRTTAARNSAAGGLRRFASRTTIFRRAIDDGLFQGKALRRSPGKPLHVINAAELRTGSAFYFTAEQSGSWRFGTLDRPEISYAEAVTASAAYPLLLPALDLEWPFISRTGARRRERISLTDGGVYDNLGLAPLWPDRDPQISLNVVPVEAIICCRAGYGLRQDAPHNFLVGRLSSAFACLFDRTQNAAVKRLFDLQASGALRGVILPYLGQDDSRLKYPPVDLVRREEVAGYPTDFSAMTPDWIERLVCRGEQVTKALLAEHGAALGLST